MERLKTARFVRTLVEHAFALAPSNFGSALGSTIGHHDSDCLIPRDTPFTAVSRCSPLLILASEHIPLP